MKPMQWWKYANHVSVCCLMHSFEANIQQTLWLEKTDLSVARSRVTRQVLPDLLTGRVVLNVI